MEKKVTKPKCYNCKFSGQPFKIANKTYMHCEDEKQYPEEKLKEGEISPWETLREFWETCKNHEFKPLTTPLEDKTT